MTKRTHTHRGHCQICGRLHAVDNVTGRLAAHGYEIPPHWHQRTASCSGAAELPYEKSRDLIPSFVASLKNAAKFERRAAKHAREFALPEVHHGSPNAKIARAEDGTLTFRTYTEPTSWERKAGAKPTLKSERTVAEYFATWTDTSDAEKQTLAREWYEEGCERVARGHDYDAKMFDADAARWQNRYDNWKPDQPLVPVEAEDNVIVGYKSRRISMRSFACAIWPVNATGKKCGPSIEVADYKACNAKLKELEASLKGSK